MKQMGNMLLDTAAGSEIMLGNTALVRAMLEAGVRVVTAYPGSPTPEIAAAIAALPPEKNPLYFEFSVNEKVATEVAAGAALNGHLACVFFKSVGLNVAADSFVQLGHLNLTGGLVIVLGDDPGANSSQNEQDNRHYAKLAYLPLFEPATPAEAYRLFKQAADWARRQQTAVILRLTTHVCHAKQKVAYDAWSPQPLDHTPRFAVEHGPYIPIAARVFPLKRRALEKLQAAAAAADASGWYQQTATGHSRRGIITMGLPYLSLREALAGMETRPDILKLELVYPLPQQTVLAFLRQHDEVKILEELDDIVEQEVRSLAQREGLPVRIIGKSDIDDWLGEYTPDKVRGILRKTWPKLLSAAPQLPPVLAQAPRPPQLCPGCGHRSAFYAVKQALPPEAISVADIGCHTLGFLPPYELGQVLLSMGHSSATGAGLALFNKQRPVVAFLGDSTFFHAGLPAIVNAVYNQHSFLLILLENGTTAMTGHQDHPAVGRNWHGPVEKIPVRQVLSGLGVTNIREVDAYQQAKLTAAVQEALTEPGFKVIIAKHPCMLQWTKNSRRRGRKLPPPVTISESCDRRHTCVQDFGCPSFQRQADGRVIVSDELCIGDGSCRQTCGKQAIVTKGGSADEPGTV